MGVFYRKGSLELLSSGNFSLCLRLPMSPPVCRGTYPSSHGDLGRVPSPQTGRRFHFYNTHFAHRSSDAAARAESARVLMDRLKRLPATPISF